MQTYAYGFPRLGKNKEFKKSIESFWNREISESELLKKIKEIETERISTYENFGVKFPLAEITLYDNILDNALIFGVYPYNKRLDSYFKFARGKSALKLKKFFNTNYHYLVPEIKKNTKFKIQWRKPLEWYKVFKKNQPLYMIGPFTFLKLSNLEDKVDFAEKLAELFSMYLELFKEFEKEGIKEIHLDEPAFVLDLSKKEVKFLKKLYKENFQSLNLDIYLFTYYESVDFLKELLDFPVKGIGLDFIQGYENYTFLRKTGFCKDKILFSGIINAKVPIREHIPSKADFVKKILKIKGVSEKNLFLSVSCPLFGLPVSLEKEKNMPKRLRRKLSFAKEKLKELKLLKGYLEGRFRKEALEWSKSSEIFEFKDQNIKYFDTLSLSKKEFLRRKRLHQKLFNLPLFPTTTIGSFPQDKELRNIRALYRKNKISKSEYEKFIKEKIKRLIRFQEQIGLDVLVHGEFERTDMVEFFAQRLKGFYTTQSGWIISYGTRVYRPPIICDRVERKAPLTVKEITFAQSLTKKFVKGIITGPVTILGWSYNITKNPPYKVAFQIAKALNKEIKELIKKGIKIIQIDEPAFREQVPLKKRKQRFYFSWAIRAFNLTCKTQDFVQIHTHMCYSEFKDILNQILKLNFDVITIEAMRSKGDVLSAFESKKFVRDIGPGVWDIHSVYVPKIEEMKVVIEKALKVLKPGQIWINPDCGLKTRNYKEVNSALKKMVKLAKILRKRYSERIREE